VIRFIVFFVNFSSYALCHLIFKIIQIVETYVGNPLGHTKATTTLAWGMQKRIIILVTISIMLQWLHHNNIPLSLKVQGSLMGFYHQCYISIENIETTSSPFFLALNSFALTKWTMKLPKVANCKQIAKTIQTTNQQKNTSNPTKL
jgi:hypothetical protein